MKIKEIITIGVLVIMAGLGASFYFLYLKDGFNLKTLPSKTPKFYYVQSGSMEPIIKVGSVVVVFPENLLQRPVSPVFGNPKFFSGDIISFKQGKEVVTHRVRAIENQGREFVYQTKGDANKTADTQLISEAQVLGKVVVAVPYVGYWAGFAQKPQGFVLLVIIPATIIIYEEIKSVKREVDKAISRLKASLFPEKTISIKKDEKPISKTFVIIPLLGAMLLFIAYSSSYFSDLEKTTNNYFQAAANFDTTTPPQTQIASHVVINEIYYDPNSTHMSGATPDEKDFEWIELYNPTNSSVNLKNWKITDNSTSERSISESNQNIAPGGFIILAKASNVRSHWDFSNDIFVSIGQNLGNGLANAGDRVILKDNNGNIVDQMSYGTDISIFNPSVFGVTEGHSLEREPDGKDTDAAGDFVNRTNPTPGS